MVLPTVSPFLLNSLVTGKKENQFAIKLYRNFQCSFSQIVTLCIILTILEKYTYILKKTLVISKK